MSGSGKGECAHARGWAAVYTEVDAEGGGLGDEESNFALASGIESSAAESEVRHKSWSGCAC